MLPVRNPYPRDFHLTNLITPRGIAWSKWGSIASITSNGHGLEFRNLRCHPENGTWGLSKPTTIPQLLNNLDGGPLKHLSWSPTGTELAVIDSAGRVTLLQIFASLNKPMGYRPCGPEAPDDLHAVVGCFWLNLAHLPNRSGVRTLLEPTLYSSNLSSSNSTIMAPQSKKHRAFGTMLFRLLFLDLFIRFSRNLHFYMSLLMELFGFCGYRVMANGSSHTQNLKASSHRTT